MTIDEIQDAIVEEMSRLGDWMDKYEYLIGLGKAMPSADAGIRNEHNAMPGCQSDVWIRAELRSGTVRFSADSDSLITKGMLSLLIRVLNERSPAEIAGADLYFIVKTGLSTNLSPSRANGLALMVKRMKSYGSMFLSDDEPPPDAGRASSPDG